MPSCADHSPLSAGGATLGLHGGGFQSDGGGGGGFGGGSTFFNYANGQFLNGLLTVAYELETVRKGEGGFACVAGCEPRPALKAPVPHVRGPCVAGISTGEQSAKPPPQRSCLRPSRCCDQRTRAT